MTHTSSFAGASASAVAQGVAASTRSVMVSQKPIVIDQPGGAKEGGSRASGVKGGKCLDGDCAQAGSTTIARRWSSRKNPVSETQRKPYGLPIAPF